ncbi:MAG: DUF6678 family protein [Brevundimonas sp.]
MAKLLRPRDLGAERDRDRADAQRDYAGSVMSDTKWRSALYGLLDPDLNLQQVIIKFIGSDREHRMRLPGLHPPHGYFYSGEFGVYPIVAIEWLEVPQEAEYPTGRLYGPQVRYEVQDLDGARAVLTETGKKYVIEETPRGFRIIGHVAR